MRTNQAAVIAAHLAERPKLVSFIIYGYLPVTAVLMPDRAVEYKDNRRTGNTLLFYRARAIVGSETFGNVEIEEYRVNRAQMAERGRHSLLLYVARQAARRHVDSGESVRGREYRPDKLHVWISRKREIDRDLSERMSGWQNSWYLASMLADRKQQLQYLKKSGQIGSTVQKGEEWLR